MKDQPKANRVYSLTGLGNSIANGNSWSECVIKCELCKKELTSHEASRGKFCSSCYKLKTNI